MELYTGRLIENRSVDWRVPLSGSRPYYYNNVCTLNKMVLTRVPLTYTFGRHNVVGPSFRYNACQRECMDAGLVGVHVKCLSSDGWDASMDDAFRYQMGKTHDMQSYIHKRCRPKQASLLLLPQWVSRRLE
jgi:hypothetical protein